MTAACNLLVIRSQDIDAAADFYRLLGFNFSKHRHGNGPEHFAAETPGLVFEIYPIGKSNRSTSAVRLGFGVDDVDATFALLTNRGAEVRSDPTDSPWGRRAVVRDPDGHTLELTAVADRGASKLPTDNLGVAPE